VLLLAVLPLFTAPFFFPSLSLEFTDDASDRKFYHAGFPDMGPSAYLRIDLLPNKLTSGPKTSPGPLVSELYGDEHG
jgi:hypothetical protein